MQSKYYIDHMINPVYEIENFIIRINDRPICKFKHPPVESHKFGESIKNVMRLWWPVISDNQSLICDPPSYGRYLQKSKYQGTSRIQAFKEKSIAYLSKITKFAKNKWNLLKKDTYRLLIEGLTDCPVFTLARTVRWSLIKLKLREWTQIGMNAGTGKVSR